MWVICDAAQSFGATYKGRKVGTIGDLTTTSFFPAKPLGCYGDGGAMFTDDDETDAVLQSLRVHGQGSDKYDNVRIGMNARLDTMQAAVLIEKLAIFADEIEARDRVAARYDELLRRRRDRAGSAGRAHQRWAQYTVRLPAGCDRDTIAAPAEGGGRADRGLLCQAAAPADRLSRLSCRRQRPAGIGAAGRRSAEPADASLSRPHSARAPVRRERGWRREHHCDTG